MQRASLGEPATAALVVGCWALGWEDGPVTPAGLGGPVPDSVLLRDEVVFGTRERLLAPATHPTGRAAEPDGASTWETRYVLNRWWIEDEALRLRFSDGEDVAWNVIMTVDTEDLVGVAEYDADSSPSGAPVQVGVRANKITCGFE